jgi:hypothetical protein
MVNYNALIILMEDDMGAKSSNNITLALILEQYCHYFSFLLHTDAPS